MTKTPESGDGSSEPMRHRVEADIRVPLRRSKEFSHVLPGCQSDVPAAKSGAIHVVDEMGYDPMTRDKASLFFRLVSCRYGRDAMIITANKSIRD